MWSTPRRARRWPSIAETYSSMAGSFIGGVLAARSSSGEGGSPRVNRGSPAGRRSAAENARGVLAARRGKCSLRHHVELLLMEERIALDDDVVAEQRAQVLQDGRFLAAQRAGHLRV